MSIPWGYKYLRYCERGKIREGGILEVPPFSDLPIMWENISLNIDLCSQTGLRLLIHAPDSLYLVRLCRDDLDVHTVTLPLSRCNGPRFHLTTTTTHGQWSDCECRHETLSRISLLLAVNIYLCVTFYVVFRARTPSRRSTGTTALGSTVAASEVGVGGGTASQTS